MALADRFMQWVGRGADPRQDPALAHPALAGRDHRLGRCPDQSAADAAAVKSRLHHIASNIRRPATNGLPTAIHLKTTDNVTPAYIPRATTSMAPTFLSIAVSFFFCRTITDDRINAAMKLQIIRKCDIWARQQHQSRSEKNAPHSLLPMKFS